VGRIAHDPLTSATHALGRRSQNLGRT
jgi:hypothetical protein